MSITGHAQKLRFFLSTVKLVGSKIAMNMFEKFLIMEHFFLLTREIPKKGQLQTDEEVHKLEFRNRVEKQPAAKHIKQLLEVARSRKYANNGVQPIGKNVQLPTPPCGSCPTKFCNLCRKVNTVCPDCN